MALRSGRLVAKELPCMVPDRRASAARAVRNKRHTAIAKEMLYIFGVPYLQKCLSVSRLTKYYNEILNRKSLARHAMRVQC
jgi:hypothetical protein